VGIVCHHSIFVLYDGQPVSHAFFQNRRETGPANSTPPDTCRFISICSHIFALAGCSAHFPFLHYHIFGLQKQDSMNFSVQVRVMPLKELLDPQGKAVMGGLQNLGIKAVQDVRIGKTIQLQVDASSADEAKKIAEDASKKLLANPVMEYFEISVA
jgi:phosphoribosylformylglycinamidine synthase PurS subunit